MSRRRYVRVRAPWNAVLDLSSPRPAAFYVGLIAQTLEYGAPAARRGGAAWALAGRRGLPEGALARALRAGGAALPAAEPLDDVLQVVAQAWPSLREGDPTLPPLPRLSGLQLARASATTTFVFGDDRAPLLVAKTARGTTSGITREVAALEEAAPTGVAPRYFGVVPGAGHVQRGLRGRALGVVPLTPQSAARLAWTPAHDAAADGFAALARGTRKDVVPAALQDDVLDDVVAGGPVPASTRAAVRAAREAVGQLPVSVLRHTDTSPQNVLLDGSRLSGLVDWEDAQTAGLPGADAWNLALACIDKGVGLARWSEQRLDGAFAAAWFGSEFGRQARAAGRRCASAAGVAAELLEPLEVVFFARRVGHRMRRPQGFPTSADVAGRALERVCRER